MRPHFDRPSTLLAAFVIGIGLLLLLGVSHPSVAATPMLRLVAPEGTAPTDGELSVDVYAASVVNLGSWEATLSYDRSLLTLVRVESAPAFGLPQPECTTRQSRCAVSLGPRPILGGVSVGAVSLGALSGLHGDGLIARLYFQPTGQPGVAALSLSDALVTDISGQAITPQTEGALLSLGVTLDQRVFLPAVNHQASAGE
ncbi:MAG TPA: hypothetical protein GYA08_25400 [Chloroflexi bacterium]|nr:hypothetical protein [Chloroflexota bacterium]